MPQETAPDEDPEIEARLQAARAHMRLLRGDELPTAFEQSLTTEASNLGTFAVWQEVSYNESTPSVHSLPSLVMSDGHVVDFKPAPNITASDGTRRLVVEICQPSFSTQSRPSDLTNDRVPLGMYVVQYNKRKALCQVVENHTEAEKSRTPFIVVVNNSQQHSRIRDSRASTSNGSRPNNTNLSSQSTRTRRDEEKRGRNPHHHQ